MELSVNLCGITIDNPVIPASGTFGYGKEYAQLYDINLLGTFSFKGTTLMPRFGNAQPRIAECGNGMLNAVGLQNPGVDTVVERELPELSTFFHKPVMANVCGFSEEEYALTAGKLAKAPNVGWLEINISCPNVHGGGMSFGVNPQSAERVTRAVKKVTQLPVIVKLSPNVTDIQEMAAACERGGADGISLINTLLGMRIDLRSKKPVLANTRGGYSGGGIFPVALRMVYDVYKAVKIPIIGMGGITTAEDVVEMLLAGATAVQVGTANLINPYVCKEIIEKLPTVYKRYGFKSTTEIIGGAH